MGDIDIRVAGCAGRITLNRPKALNALTYGMCLEIDTALRRWRDDNTVACIVMDAAGDRAFCAGGDIAELYETGQRGDFDYGRKFWRDEYRMNAAIFEYPKPVISFLQGFTMGGGVGVGCHGTHRVVCENSAIAMPECGIGLVPDVGGSLILALAPGRLGEYLGLTTARMDAGDAIRAGFADHYIPRARWADLIARLEKTGDATLVATAAEMPPQGALAPREAQIDALFAGATLADIVNALKADDSDFATDALRAMGRNSPLSMGCTVEMLHRLRGAGSIRQALEMEYRFTHRAMEHGDFLEGIRAAIIDKDRNPDWRHDLDPPPAAGVYRMLLPLGDDTLTFEGE
ncbi:enoyl-CoA hydratase/isomerase family protein [Pukyongiella litopenaei]|uniref:3-hydroxyisobutyryl-CoA hydrolase n=1 Tax=Pukyongiella litopenaei TaxID=2605946 RepID=A0A2S0MT83_9RHOB|nr:enoyl-CoA hydratase/isomerase family protein [Pukyongiella litopenaei]AVO39082.1 enoyl-CoA hydratase/isomerase family protein [Pukyongiella litopenaei]